MLLAATLGWAPHSVRAAAPGSASRARAARGRRDRPPASAPRRVHQAAPLAAGPSAAWRRARQQDEDLGNSSALPTVLAPSPSAWM